MTILIGEKLPVIPPGRLLEEAITTGNLEDLEQWFITSRAEYSFQVVVDYVTEERSKPRRVSAYGSVTHQGR